MPWYDGDLDVADREKREEFLSNLSYHRNRLRQGSLSALDYNTEMLPSQIVSAIRELRDLIDNILIDIDFEERRRMQEEP